MVSKVEHANMIEISKLTKKFGDFTAVDSIDLNIRKGEIFGILGPNGAGKTTTINMILGLLQLTSGRIVVDGLDIKHEHTKIKKLIGFMTQETVVDGDLTATENLQIACGLYHVPVSEISDRIAYSLKDANLQEFSTKRAGTFSGGMQRRLALVKAMVHVPKILILDEPTTGLDIQNRTSMWGHIRDLKSKGVTVILTTQYLEEADSLCDRIAIIDHGKIRGLGTVSELKSIIGTGTVLEVISRLDDIPKIVKILKERFKLNPTINADKVNAFLGKDSIGLFKKIVDVVAESKIEVLSISMHLPTLDDVFLKLTGSTLRDTVSEGSGTSQMTRARMMRR